MALCRSCEKREARVAGLCGHCSARALRSSPQPYRRPRFQREKSRVVKQIIKG